MGPHQALKADGGDTERGIVSFSENFGRKIRARVVAQIPGLEFDLTDFLRVLLQVHFVEAATGKVVVSESWHPLAGAFAEMVDRRIS